MICVFGSVDSFFVVFVVCFFLNVGIHEFFWYLGGMREKGVSPFLSFGLFLVCFGCAYRLGDSDYFLLERSVFFCYVVFENYVFIVVFTLLL